MSNFEENRISLVDMNSSSVVLKDEWVYLVQNKDIKIDIISLECIEAFVRNNTDDLVVVNDLNGIISKVEEMNEGALEELSIHYIMTSENQLVFIEFDNVKNDEADKLIMLNFQMPDRKSLTIRFLLSSVSGFLKQSTIS